MRVENYFGRVRPVSTLMAKQFLYSSVAQKRKPELGSFPLYCKPLTKEYGVIIITVRVRSTEAMVAEVLILVLATSYNIIAII